MNFGNENSFKLYFESQQMDHGDKERTVNLDVGDAERRQSVDAGSGGAWGLPSQHSLEIGPEIRLEICHGRRHSAVVVKLRPV